MGDFVNKQHYDKFVVKENGTLWYQQIEKSNNVTVTKDQYRMASETLNQYSGVKVSENTLGFKVTIDIPIAQYREQINKQRRIELKEKKEAEQWQKVVQMAEMVSIFVPVFGVVGVTCKLFRAATTLAKIVDGVDKLHQFTVNPQAVLTEELFQFLLGQGYKQVLMLDKLKLNANQNAVFELIRDNTVENSGLSDKTKNLISINVLG